MSTQQIVDPGNIEPGLIKLWEGLAKEKMRACLFNLIVYNQLDTRTDYIRTIVQKVSEKYPCRVLFITNDPKAEKQYLKTAISVVGDGNIACDYIDIGVAGSDIEKVPYILLPHFVPDLPIALLWTDDPAKDHQLFSPLLNLTHRVIFDSESADNLLDFSKTILAIKNQKDIADLNWARTEGWRELIASLFHSGKRIEQIKDVTITFNAKETKSFCHLKIQAIYLLSWLMACLKWKLKSANKSLEFTFENQTAKIVEDRREKIGPGTIISIRIETDDGFLYEACRIPEQPHHVEIKTSSPEMCQTPYRYVLGETETGQSLTQEIITKGTSKHYIQMLEAIQELNKDQLC